MVRRSPMPHPRPPEPSAARGTIPMQILTPAGPSANGTPAPAGGDGPAGTVLGFVQPDTPEATNERVIVRVSAANRPHVVRGQFVRIEDRLSKTQFLGRVVAGPFFPVDPDGEVLVRVELHGGLIGRRTVETSDRPAALSPVRGLTPDLVGELLGCTGDMLLGTLAGCDRLSVGLQSRSKEVLPRNVGIFGPVGSGKSNAAQVLIEEASARGWAVIVLDVEGEYVGMDAPGETPGLADALARYEREPAGLSDFRVCYPVGCTSERPESS